jgi:uncharacterized protein
MRELTPTPPRERSTTLDVLRGFAMLGVLLANLFTLFSYRFAQHGPPPPETLADTIASWFMHLAVASRAQTLLTFLFGFGFAAQLLRAQARREPVMPVYLRRLFALLAIGWLHVLLLSWVDVTWGYALIGFFLLPFIRTSNRTRLAVALALTVVPAIVYAIPEVWPALHGLLFEHPRRVYIDEFVVAARSGDRGAIMRAHATLATVWTFGGGVGWYLPWLLGRFLLGYVAGSQRWFERDGADHLSMFRRFLVYGSLVAVPGLALPVLERTGIFDPRAYGLPAAMTTAVVVQLSLLGQVAAYVAAVVVLVRRPRWRALLGVIAPVGRMPLTTYLMQSLICTSLFYGWGLDWSTPAPAPCVVLGFAIFAVQVAFAHLWLRWFQFGPAEWLWRLVVYLEPPPMRLGARHP